MSHLIINDLPHVAELDKQAIMATAGGRGFPFFQQFRRIAQRLTNPRQGGSNNVDFGNQNSFAGNTAGINYGIQAIFNFNF